MAIEPTSLDMDRSVRRWIAMGSGMSGRAVIPQNEPAAPAPQGLYATVLDSIETAEGLNFIRYGRGVDQGEELSSQSLEIMFSVQWYRSGARDAGRCFHLWASSPAGIEAAEAAGFTFYRASELRRLDAIDDADWEERVGLDLYLGFLVTQSRTASIIGSTEIDICLDGEEEVRVSLEDAP